MTNDTMQRPAGRGARAWSFAARRPEDRDVAGGRQGSPFHRSAWSAYLESQMFGSAWAARRERG